MVSFPNGVMRRNLIYTVTAVSLPSDLVGNTLPSVKLSYSSWGVGCENAEYVDEEGLPHSKLKLMQQIHRE